MAGTMTDGLLLRVETNVVDELRGLLTEQTEILKTLATAVADAHDSQVYTLTGASDWPMLGAVGTLLLAAIYYMWRENKAQWKDIKNIIRGNRIEGREEFGKITSALDSHRVEWRMDLDKESDRVKAEHDKIWTFIRQIDGK